MSDHGRIIGIDNDPTPRQPLVQATLPAVRKIRAGQIHLDIMSTPLPDHLGWQPPRQGLMARFGTRASALSSDVAGQYPCQLMDVSNVKAVFDFGDIDRHSRVFSLEHYPGKRWLDVRAMSESLSRELKTILDLDDFDSWNIRRNILTPQTRAMMSPDRLEQYMDQIEDVLGPLDLIILPVNSADKKAPVYAWVRRIDALVELKARGMDGAVKHLPEIDWAV